MVTQYPHIATVVTSTSAGRDDKGYPLPPQETTLSIICRAEAPTRFFSDIVYLSDGTAYQFRYVVYIKAGQPEIPVNSVITSIVWADDNSVLLSNAIVKTYSKGQFNATLWV